MENGMGLDSLKARHDLLKAIRAFFYRNDYLEVETAYLSGCPAPDAYIEPLRVFVGTEGPFFLHTSPEMGMKKLLLLGHKKIFQVCKVFRVEEFEEHHNTEFTMLEWYMPGTYQDAMLETKRLVKSVVEELKVPDSYFFERPWKCFDLGELCLERAGINPLPLDEEGLFAAMRDKGITGIRQDEIWQDLFFKLFIQEVEPRLNEKAPFFIQDWPRHLSSMAKEKDDHTVERFELYMKHLEIANGYTELLDPEEQLRRFLRENDTRRKLGREPLRIDREFLETLRRLEGPCSGVSVGVDRLLMVLLGHETIDDVLHARFRPGRCRE
jgi:lysyl-tRNA synthetase class 2